MKLTSKVFFLSSLASRLLCLCKYDLGLIQHGRDGRVPTFFAVIILSALWGLKPQAARYSNVFLFKVCVVVGCVCTTATMNNMHTFTDS